MRYSWGDACWDSGGPGPTEYRSTSTGDRTARHGSEAVAAPAAALLLDGGVLPTDAGVRAALRRAAPATRRGFAAFAEESRASEARGSATRAGRQAGAPGRRTASLSNG
jgi:hypothetical protein